MKSLWLVPPQGEPIAVGKSPTVVGRDAACDIAVSHHSISRRHALVERSGSEWTVADQTSANGTWIDGQRIIRAYLRHGQRVRFGAVVFEVKVEEGAAAAPPEPRARPNPEPARAPVTPAPPPAPTPAPPAPTPATPTPAPPAPAPPPAPPPAPTPTPALPAGLAAVSRAQASELLGIAPGASAQEIRRQYQRIYNDYQIRLTNAPTASLKRMYQKNLQELKAAVEVLAPGLLARDGS